METKKSRIPLLPRSEWTEAARDIFEILEGPEARERGPRYDSILIFAQNPELSRPFLDYNRYILQSSTLPDRDRELVTLYVAWSCRSEYEWLSHVRESRRIGMTDEEIEQSKAGPASPFWTGHDRLLLVAVDQMRTNYMIDDATWAALAETYSVRQMMDLTFTIGNYIMFAAVANSLRIQPEPGEAGAGLAAQYGSP